MSQHRDGSDRPNPHSLWQTVTNKDWPAPGVAKALRDAPREQQIEVIARVVFEIDGEQHLAGRAVRWTKRHVCVTIDDPRLQVAYVWLAASDVRRASD